jgi:serine/threonine protein kinase/tetratricopeptide (TPR) repeat protein
MGVSAEQDAFECPHCHARIMPSSTASAAGGELVAGETVHLEPGAVQELAFGFSSGESDIFDTAPPRPVSEVASSRVSARREAGGIRVGKYFGDYKILSEIARGGMGIVYLAEQESLRRTVALKVLRAGEGASEEDFSRFLREAEAAASLSHPNIVPIHELNVFEDQPFFTMDFVDGVSLERMSVDGHVTLRQAAEIIEKIALAIQYAHDKGIVHRDLKPANVLFTRGGVPKITDFGLAVNLSHSTASQRMTHSGVVMGTIPYIPPEQAAGDVSLVGPKADIYSMGAILYEMITGQPPFEGEAQFELLHKVMHEEPVAPRKLNAKLPPDLETICLHCLEKSMDRRYESAQALADDCRAFLNGEVIKARPATTGYRLYRFVARQRILVGLSAALCLLFLIFLAVTTSLQGENEEKDKALKQNKRMQAITRKKLADVEAEKEELTAALDPGWREMFSDRFRSGNLQRHWVLNAGRVRFQRGYILLTGRKSLPVNKSDLVVDDSGTEVAKVEADVINIGLRAPYPRDVRLVFKVYLPKENSGALGILLSGLGYNLGGTFGYYFHLGSPAAPGARIDKGPATLASTPNAILDAGRWHTVQIQRSGTTLSLYLNGKRILETTDETILRSDEHSRVGFHVAAGQAFVDDVRVYAPGSSLQMKSNMLDMADSFYRNAELDWAIRMAEYVAKEPGESGQHLRAMHRLIACYVRKHRNPQVLQTKFAAFLKSFRKDGGYHLRPGEADYMRGLLNLEIRNYPEAVRYFDKAGKVRVKNEEQRRFMLLGQLQGVLARIRRDKLPQAVAHLQRLHERDGLRDLARLCKEELSAGDMHAVFLNEVDRLLDQKQTPLIGIFLEALVVLFPESGRDVAARAMRLSMLLEAAGNTSAALDRLVQAQSLAPDWEDPYLFKGELLLRADQVEEAQTAFEDAAQRFSMSVAAQKRLAEFLIDDHELRDPEAAVVAVERAVVLTRRKDPALLDLLSAAAEDMGDIPLAYRAAQEANELSPSDERLLRLQTFRERYPGIISDVGQ